MNHLGYSGFYLDGVGEKSRECFLPKKKRSFPPNYYQLVLVDQVKPIVTVHI